MIKPVRKPNVPFFINIISGMICSAALILIKYLVFLVNKTQKPHRKRKN